MNIKSWVAAASLCLLPFTSQAGVIYEWQALNGETPIGISLQLEFDDSVVQSGAFSLYLDPETYTENARHGLLGLRYSFPTDGGEAGMNYSPSKGFGHEYGYLDMQLTFGADGFLSGYIYANNSEHDFGMESQGQLFTVVRADSDRGMEGAGCGWTIGIECGGAAGHIQRTGVTANRMEAQVGEVPEPGSLALFGAGLLAACGLRRKTVK